MSIRCPCCGEEKYNLVKVQGEMIPLCFLCQKLLKDMGEDGFLQYFSKLLKKYRDKHSVAQ